MDPQLELGRSIDIANRAPQNDHESQCLGLWLRHAAATEKHAAKAVKQATRAEHKARRDRAASWKPTTAFELACAVLGEWKRPHADEAVELVGTSGIRAVLGIAPLRRDDGYDLTAVVVQSQRRSREIEVEHARLVREQGTIAAARWRDAQSVVTVPALTAEELALREADQVVEAGLARIADAIHASIPNDGAFHDAPLRDPEAWAGNGDGRFQIGQTLGQELRRRLAEKRSLQVASFAQTSRADPSAHGRPMQGADGVNIRQLLPLFAIPAWQVELWLGDSDVIARYSLCDLWSE